MPQIFRSTLSLAALIWFSPVVAAQPPSGRHHGGGPSFDRSGGDSFRPAITSLGIVSGGYYGPNTPYRPNPLIGDNPWRELMLGPFGPVQQRGQEGPGGLRLPHPYQVSAVRPAAPGRPINAGRAVEMVEMGDRAFRGGNYHRAEDRYHLAAKANRESPDPHLHLAQVAVIRGDYATAAGHLRDAVASSRGPEWLLNTPDIQAMYGEPGDFAKQLARLESYLQTRPDDRDAWFVLGAENYLTGRHQFASDAFVRLSDRRPDQALAAFMDASSVALQRSKSDTSIEAN